MPRNHIMYTWGNTVLYLIATYYTINFFATRGSYLQLLKEVI